MESRENNTYELSNNSTEKQGGYNSNEVPEAGVVLSQTEWAELNEVAKEGFTQNDQRDMQRMGKKQEFRVRRSPTASTGDD